MSWKERAIPAATKEVGNKSSWRDRAIEKPVDPEIQERVRGGGSTAATLRQGAQGVLGGFYDELGGLLETIPNYIKQPDQGVAGSYRQGRDYYRDLLKETERQYPTTSKAANLGGSVGGVGRFTKGLKQLLTTGGLIGLGESEADLTKGELGQTAKDAGKSAVMSAALGKAADMAAPYIGKLTTAAAKPVKRLAGKMAKSATGATGKQMLDKFADDAGEQLLNRGLIRALDTPGKIANRASSAISKANQSMDDVMKSLDDRGVSASPQEIVDAINERLTKIGKKDFSKKAEKDLLAKVRDDITSEIQNATRAEAGPVGVIPLTSVEQTKRGLKKVNWAEPDKAIARKEAYRALRDLVENKTKEIDPELLNKFKDAKQTYGLLNPIEEMASRRAAVEAQSPFGGLLDSTLLAGGLASGNMAEGLTAMIARRLLAPRAKATAAVGANQLSKGLLNVPNLIQRAAPIIGAKRD
jgi:hypothetical protein